MAGVACRARSLKDCQPMFGKAFGATPCRLRALQFLAQKRTDKNG